MGVSWWSCVTFIIGGAASALVGVLWVLRVFWGAHKDKECSSVCVLALLRLLTRPLRVFPRRKRNAYKSIRGLRDGRASHTHAEIITHLSLGAS